MDDLKNGDVSIAMLEQKMVLSVLQLSPVLVKFSVKLFQHLS